MHHLAHGITRHRRLAAKGESLTQLSVQREHIGLLYSQYANTDKTSTLPRN